MCMQEYVVRLCWNPEYDLGVLSHKAKLASDILQLPRCSHMSSLLSLEEMRIQRRLTKTSQEMSHSRYSWHHDHLISRAVNLHLMKGGQNESYLHL